MQENPNRKPASKKPRGRRSSPAFTIGVVAGTAGIAVALFLLMTLFRGETGERQTGAAASSHAAVSSGLSSGGAESGLSLASGLPKASQTAVSQPKDPLLVLVNRFNAMPEDYQSTLVEIHNTVMDERIRRPFEQMYDAAAAEGAILWISSGYRDADRQEALYQREIQQNLSSGMTEEQAAAQADIAVARGGYSEHNTGLAIDLNGVQADFLETRAGKWMAQHAEEYGFILRFPADKQEETGIMYEPWHYRYVGKEHALKMKELGMCLEEYVDYLAKNGG